MSKELMDKTNKQLLVLIENAGVEITSKMKVSNKAELIEVLENATVVEERIIRPEVVSHRESSNIEKVEVTQTPKQKAQENRKIVMNPDDLRDQQLAGIKKKEGGEDKVVFVCGYPQKFLFAETEARREIKQPDGSIISSIIPAKEMDFKNGIFETSDPELIALAIKSPQFGKKFCYHKAYLPDDAPQFIKDRSLQLSQTIKDAFNERRLAIERARDFVEEHHPEDGDYGKITDENPDPNPISELK